MLALEGERVLAQRTPDDLHRLLEDLAVERIGCLLIRIVLRPDRHALVVQVQHLARHRAPTDSEHRPTARQVVQCCEVLGEPQRIPLRDHVEHGTEAQAGGLCGDPGGDQQTVRDDLVALVLEVVFGRPERVVPESFGFDRGVDVVERRVPARFVRVAAIHRVRRPAPASVISTPPKKNAPSLRSCAATVLVSIRRYVRMDGVDTAATGDHSSHG